MSLTISIVTLLIVQTSINQNHRNQIMMVNQNDVLVHLKQEIQTQHFTLCWL